MLRNLQPSDEDEETRAYRLEIEKQKQLREKIMRDKELKRRRAAEEKLHEVSAHPYFFSFSLNFPHEKPLSEQDTL